MSLAPEEEVQLEWLFCLASSRERMWISLAPSELKPAQADALVVLVGDPSRKPASVVFRAA